jgi:hypothetical protein
MTKEQEKFCETHGLTPDQFTGKETVGGYLDLESLTSIPEGFNPTVGGYLYLCSLTSIPEGFNPTVGGSLYLGSLTSIPEGFNPTVGGYLYLGSLTSGKRPEPRKTSVKEMEKLLSWENGRYRMIDGIFCEILRDKGQVMKVLIKGKKQYIVTDGENYAHGDSVKEARESLIYKISDRDCSEYEALGLDAVLTFPKAIEAYRKITGACDTGTKMFVEGVGEVKSEYTVQEIIAATAGQYGGEAFKAFFEKNNGVAA